MRRRGGHKVRGEAAPGNNGPAGEAGVPVPGAPPGPTIVELRGAANPSVCRLGSLPGGAGWALFARPDPASDPAGPDPAGPDPAGLAFGRVLSSDILATARPGALRHRHASRSVRPRPLLSSIAARKMRSHTSNPGETADRAIFHAREQKGTLTRSLRFPFTITGSFIVDSLRAEKTTGIWKQEREKQWPE